MKRRMTHAVTRKLRISATAFSVALLALLITAVGVSAAANSQLAQHHVGLCIDVPGFSKVQGVQVQLYACNGGANQQWTEIPFCFGSSTYCNNVAMIQNKNSGLCLNVSGGRTANFTPAIQWACDPTASNEVFKVMPSVYGPPNWILKSGIGTCLDDPGLSAKSGTKLEFYQCNRSEAQIWRSTSAWVGVM